jgi:putative Holliday junction resolvase
MRILAIDYGSARIGLALGDPTGTLARPLPFVPAKADAKLAREIVDIAKKNDVHLFVLGLPRNMDGTYGPAAEKVRAFAEKLRAACGCEIKLWDERLTSVAAQRSLHEAGHNVKSSRKVIDQVAAQLILQGWLDSQAML